ncbi:hypothetical protein C8J56DRAFT_1140344 [Mycena floridula]|nr:hypothetical protein C8J56DRAFT_1140344 [Mycena floridula]
MADSLPPNESVPVILSMELQLISFLGRELPQQHQPSHQVENWENSNQFTGSSVDYVAPPYHDSEQQAIEAEWASLLTQILEQQTQRSQDGIAQPSASFGWDPMFDGPSAEDPPTESPERNQSQVFQQERHQSSVRARSAQSFFVSRPGAVGMNVGELPSEWTSDRTGASSSSVLLSPAPYLYPTWKLKCLSCLSTPSPSMSSSVNGFTPPSPSEDLHHGDLGMVGQFATLTLNTPPGPLIRSPAELRAFSQLPRADQCLQVLLQALFSDRPAERSLEGLSKQDSVSSYTHMTCQDTLINNSSPYTVVPICMEATVTRRGD